MKKYISILCCMVLFLHPVSGQRAKLELVKMPIALPAADEAYGKDKRFSRVIPAAIEELAKRTDDPAGGFFANLRMTCPIAAKAVNEKKGETPDIVFEVESPGIQNFRLSPGYFAEYATNTGGMTSVTTKGYLADATFNFPMKVLVKDGQGNLKRTIIVADETEEFRMVYHSAFFRKQETGDPSLVFPATGFPTLRDLHVSIERNGKNIAMRCAKNRLEMLFKACSQAIGICYGDAYLSRKGYYFYLKKMDGWNDPAGESLAAAVDR